MLKEPFMVHSVEGATAVTLTPPDGEAYVVKDVIVDTFGSNYLSLFTDRTKVAYIRTGGNLGSHLAFARGRTKHSHDVSTGNTTGIDVTEFALAENAAGDEVSSLRLPMADALTEKRAWQLATGVYPRHETLLSYLRKHLKVFGGYPVPSGKIFKIDETPGASATVHVIYEIWDARDIRPDMPNGPDSRELVYVLYGRPASTMNDAGDYELSVLQSPSEFDNFPFGDTVPARTEIELLGILASDFVDSTATATNYSRTKYLKLQQDRKTLFDNENNGLPYFGVAGEADGDMDIVGEGFSIGGNYSDVDARPPLIFMPPKKFLPGEELKVTWTIDEGGTGSNIVAADGEVGVILRAVRR